MKITIDRTAHGDEAERFAEWLRARGWRAALGDAAEINGADAERHDSLRNDGQEPAADQYEALWTEYCGE